MEQDDSAIPLPTGLHFYWYDCKAGEEHNWYWGQLCGSMHRLVFVQEEFDRNVRIPDIELALARLEYNMENYLSRIYELRERAAKLLIVFAGLRLTGKDGQRILKGVKGKCERQTAVRGLSIDQQIQTTYLQLLSLIDDDIDLRNQNTHDTFLSLGLCTGDDLYDPCDALSDVKAGHGAVYPVFKKMVRRMIREAVQRYNDRIGEIIRVTTVLLDQTDYVPNGSASI